MALTRLARGLSAPRRSPTTRSRLRISPPTRSDSQLSDNWVGSGEIGACCGADGSRRAPSALEIGTDAVGSDEITQGIGAAEVADDTLFCDRPGRRLGWRGEIGASAVGADEITAGAVGSSELGTDAVAPTRSPRLIGSADILNDDHRTTSRGSFTERLSTTRSRGRHRGQHFTGADILDGSLSSTTFGTDSVAATRSRRAPSAPRARYRRHRRGRDRRRLDRLRRHPQRLDRLRDIADGSFTGDDILDDSITSADIADGSFTGADILDDSITSADITTTRSAQRRSRQQPRRDDIPDDSITSADILDDSLSSADLAADSVGTSEVAADALTAADLAADSVAPARSAPTHWNLRDHR